MSKLNFNDVITQSHIDRPRRAPLPQRQQLLDIDISQSTSPYSSFTNYDCNSMHTFLLFYISKTATQTWGELYTPFSSPLSFEEDGSVTTTLSNFRAIDYFVEVAYDLNNRFKGNQSVFSFLTSLERGELSAKLEECRVEWAQNLQAKISQTLQEYTGSSSKTSDEPQAKRADVNLYQLPIRQPSTSSLENYFSTSEGEEE